MPPWSNQKSPLNNADLDYNDNRIDANRYADMLIREVLTSVGRAVEAGKSIGDAFSVYIWSVENLETVCYANNWLEGAVLETYKKNLSTFLAKQNWDASKLTPEQKYQFHRVKFQYLLKEVFGGQMKFMQIEI